MNEASELNELLQIDAETVADFQRNGFVRLEGVLSPPLLGEMGGAITDLVKALNTQTKPLAERSTYDRAFLQVMNLWRHDDSVRSFVLGRRLASVAAQLLDVQAVRLYHDQALYKEPGGGLTPAHADQYYWPVDSDRTVTAWIPLQATDIEMGPLAFYAGSHQIALGRDQPISDESERNIAAAMESKGFELTVEPFSLGDVSFHRGWTFHKAGANRSSQTRSVMTIIYMDARTKLKAPENEKQRSDAAQWCPGVRVGETIASRINPIVFDRT
ncbi:MAG: phytanoyl-CoA dioxygenase family protein [Pseudomonadota bacterium]